MAHGEVPMPFVVLLASWARLAVPSWRSLTRTAKASAFLCVWMDVGTPQTMHQEALLCAFGCDGWT